MSRAREFADLAGSADAGDEGRNDSDGEAGTKSGLTGDAYFVDRLKGDSKSWYLDKLSRHRCA